MKIVDSKSILLAVVVASLLLAYVLGSLAIDSGRWLHYFLTFLTLVVGLKFLIMFFKTHGKD